MPKQGLRFEDPGFEGSASSSGVDNSNIFLSLLAEQGLETKKSGHGDLILTGALRSPWYRHSDI